MKTQNVIIFIKNQKIKYFQETKQTKNLQDLTNQKIRELGSKYYDVKNLFDKMKIHRDILFILGKELEQQYKSVKQKIHLQTQFKRIKDALIVWFTENFYTELFMPQSMIIQRLKFLENMNYIQSNQRNILSQFQINKKKDNKEKKEKDAKIKPDFGNLQINTETDDFQFSNIEKRHNQKLISISEEYNDNFNFNEFLNF